VDAGSTSWQECLVDQNYLPHDQDVKERKKKGPRPHYPLQGHTPSDWSDLSALSLSFHHLLNVSV
jgi:hypothetical protein